MSIVQEPASSASNDLEQLPAANSDDTAFHRPDLTFEHAPVCVSSVKADRSSRSDNLFRSAKWYVQLLRMMYCLICQRQVSRRIVCSYARGRPAVEDLPIVRRPNTRLTFD